LHTARVIFESGKKISLSQPKREQLKVSEKRGFLVAVVPPRHPISAARCLEELEGLAKTAGVTIVGRLSQTRDTPDTATYLGQGKVTELKSLINETKADIVIFDNALSPSQGKNLEKELNSVVVDRSEVILDIFATHARSQESMLQVELAQLLYMRPRLKRMWTHLERIDGGIGSSRGPGEKQLETDRRLVDKRITELKKRLEEVEKRREREVASRREQPRVSLVGYTNAGKSTLMNTLTNADVYVADKLFATLDTRTRRWKIPHFGDILLSDTVGFVRDLPHHLVASFKSTLEEARHAELLLHLVDASDPLAVHHVDTVNDVLQEIGAGDIPRLLVINKLDAVEDRSIVELLRSRHPGSISISAKSGTGLQELSTYVANHLGNGMVEADVVASAENSAAKAYLDYHADLREMTLQGNDLIYRCGIYRRMIPGLIAKQTTVHVDPDHVFEAGNLAENDASSNSVDSEADVDFHSEDASDPHSDISHLEKPVSSV
jgi:GTP-binding protein HflX